MSHTECPELEVFFTEMAEGHGPSLEHARSCPHCSALVEEHRQLEKDLFRLADPLPPPEFLAQVMAKVEATPTPARTEIRVGLGILGGVVGLLVVTLALGNTSTGSLSAAAASSLVHMRLWLLGMARGLDVLWRTSSLPLAAGLTVVLVFSLFALRRFAGTGSSQPEAEVSP
jgi:hypothetical protein